MSIRTLSSKRSRFSSKKNLFGALSPTDHRPRCFPLSIPYGLLVWATGNTARPLVKSMISQIGEKVQNQRRGLVVDDTLKVAGAEDVWACGDCTAT